MSEQVMQKTADPSGRIEPEMGKVGKLDNEKKQDKLDSEKKQDVLAQHILRAAGLSGDDLDSFQHIFRDASAQLRSRLIPFTPAKLWTQLQSLETLKTSDFEPIFKENGMIALFAAPRWGGDVIFILDEALISLISDAFFGSPTPSVENRMGRPFSNVEQKVTEKFALTMAAAMDDIFGTGDGSLFELKKFLPVQQFDSEAFSHARMFSSIFEVGYEETATHLRILMPRSCHRPIQEAVTRVLRAPSNRADPMWARRLRQEVSRAHVTIEAYNVQGNMTLKQLSKLQVGQILPLPGDVMNEVRLRSGSKPLYKCSLGKIGQNFSARVREAIDEEEEMIDGLVSG